MTQLFSCEKKQSALLPDSAFFECNQHQIQYDLPLHKNQKVLIAPEFIYDYVTVETTPDTATLTQVKNLYPVDTSVYGIHANDKKRKTRNDKIARESIEILLSPGTIRQVIQRVSTVPPRTGFKARTSMFTLQGSSGSPVLDSATNRAFGTLATASPVDDFPGLSSGTGFISGYDFTPASAFFTPPKPKISKNFTDYHSLNNIAFSDEFGKVASERQTRVWCPSNYAAAGIIGSSISSKTNPKTRDENTDRIGNLGLTCLPFSTTENYDFSLAKVSAGGSLDLGIWTPRVGLDLRRANEIPFNIYINEYLTSGGTTERNPKGQALTRGYQQNFTMCPPGFFLNGVWISSNQIGGIRQLEAVHLLKCKHAKTGATHFQPLRLPIGASPIRSSSQREFKVLDCPRTHVITEASISTGGKGFTSSIRFTCRKVWK